jgi:hypothetical protein
MFTATTSRRIGMVVALAATAMAAVTACGPVGGRPSIVAMVWLPGGDIVYRQVGFDGDESMMRRNGAGEMTAILIAQADAAAGPGCTSTEPGLFAAPSGDLGLSYDCPDSTRLVDVSGSGSRRIVNPLESWTVPLCACEHLILL